MSTTPDENLSAARELVLCPNPDCDQHLPPDATHCDFCGHELGACPRCGRLMSLTLGVCDCGYGLETLSGAPGEAPQERLPYFLTPDEMYAAISIDTSKGGAPVGRGADRAPAIVFRAGRRELRKALAKAYYEAALNDAPMSAAAQVLEELRTRLLSQTDTLQLLDAIDVRIGQAAEPGMQESLVELRGWLRAQAAEQLCEAVLQRLKNAAQREAGEKATDLSTEEAVFRAWVAPFAEALAEWRFFLCEALVECLRTEVNNLPKAGVTLEKIESGLRMAKHYRWIEAFPFYQDLSELAFLRPHVRALLMVNMAEIQLYWHTNTEEAGRLIDEALALAPGLPQAITGRGEIHLQAGELEDAQECFRQALELELGGAREISELALPLCFQGDLLEKAGESKAAEDFFQEAIYKDPSDTNGYTRLMRLYGKPERFDPASGGNPESARAEIETLAERAAILDVDEDYAVYQDAGDAFSSAHQLELAEKWYQKATKQDPSRAGAFSSLGYALMAHADRLAGVSEDDESEENGDEDQDEYDRHATGLDGFEFDEEDLRTDLTDEEWQALIEAEEKETGLDASTPPSGAQQMVEDPAAREAYERALQAFEQVVKRHPASYDGYYGMGQVYEKLGDYEKALQAYRQSLVQNIFLGPLLAKAGEMHWKLGQLDDAESTLLEALRLDPEGDLIIHDFCDDLYKTHAQPERAIVLLGKILDVKQQTEREYLHSYHNRVGNVHYYQAEYGAAAERYRLAIQAKPEEAVFHSNLGLALRNLGKWDEALEAFQKCYDLDKRLGPFRRETSLVWNDRGNQAYSARRYLEAGEHYKIAIDLDSNEPVYFSNLALALEKLAFDPLLSRDLESENGLDLMKRAVVALQRSLELRPKSEDEIRRLARLEGLLKYAQAYPEERFFPMGLPLVIEVDEDLQPLVWGDLEAEIPGVENEEADEDEAELPDRDESTPLIEPLASEVITLKNWSSERYALPLPEVYFRPINERDSGRFYLVLNETLEISSQAQLGYALAVTTKEELDAIGVAAYESTNPYNGHVAYLVASEEASKVSDAGLYIWSTPGYALLALARLVEQNLADLLGVQIAATLLSEALPEGEGADACGEVLNDPEKLRAFTQVLRGLAQDAIPLRPIDLLASVFLEKHAQGSGTFEIVNALRGEEEIKSILQGTHESFGLMTLGPGFARRVRAALRREDGWPSLDFDEGERDVALEKLSQGVQVLPGAGALVVPDGETRHVLRRLLAAELPYFWVITRDELPEGWEGRVFGEIEWL